MQLERAGLTRRRLLKGAGSLAALGMAKALIPFPQLRAQGLPKPGEGDWPRFGRDLHNTRFNPNEKTIGPNNVDRLKLKWQFETLDSADIHTTPAVVGSSLYFGAGGYYYGLDSASGKVKWKFEVEGRGGVDSSCQYVDGRLYFGSPLADVYCVDAATGKLIWKNSSLREEKPMGASMQYSPVVYNGKVLVGNSGSQAKIACLDAETGATRWSFRVIRDVPLDWKSGGGSLWTSGAVDEEQNVVFNGTGSNKAWMPGPMLYSESMLAHDIDTGELLWYYQVRQQDSHDLDFSCNPMIFDAVSPPRIRGDVRRCVGAGDKTAFWCWNRRTGELYWKSQFTPRGGPWLNSTAVAYNRVFVVAGVRTADPAISLTAALDAYSGEMEWLVPNGSMQASPCAVANGVLYQGLLGKVRYPKGPYAGLAQDPAHREGLVEALDANTGRKLWAFSVPSNVRGGVVIANGAVYTSNGGAASGQEDWEKLPRVPYSVYCFTIDGR